ncbi:hypothetical protein ACFE04_017151 [Oxalis oulophora]
MSSEHDLTTRLITPQPSDQSHHIITVDDTSSDSSSSDPEAPPTPTNNINNARNPYRFLGSSGLAVPGLTTVDPFVNNTPNVEGVYECVKIMICLPIATVRLVLFVVSLTVGYLATKVALQGWKDKHNPMPKWRSRFMWITRICARGILFAFGYHWIRRKGKPVPRNIAPIIVSNHVSYVEPIFFFYELFPTMVASESHDSIPFVGTIIRAMQVIYVDRFAPSSRKQAVTEIKRKASSSRFPRVLLFPEGTTTNGKSLISFQLGAFIPGYPIQPVVVRYPHVHFDQSWGNISLVKLMFRMFTQFHNFMEVEYLPVVTPPENEKENIIRFAERTSHSIASALNVVRTSHSYGDLMLITKASESKQEKVSNFLVEMARVEALFRLRSTEAVEFLEKFLAMKPDTSGRVKFHDFLNVTRLKACPLSEEIFAFMDLENIGSITFQQFLYGSAHVMKQSFFHQACEHAFVNCLVGRNDYVTEQELGDAISSTIPDLNKDEVHSLFSLFDHDSNGRVSKEDFLCCLRKNPLLIALFSPNLLDGNDLQNGFF